MNILAQIVESKKREIEALYEQYDLHELQRADGVISGGMAFRPSGNAPFTAQNEVIRGVNAPSPDGLKAIPPRTPSPLFYQRLAEAGTAKEPFFITEFKRKSPSEGWINQNADLPAQIQAYTQAGASAISILTDQPFFGGTYNDLKQARSTVNSQWSIVNGQQSRVNGQQSTVNSQRSTVNGQRSTVNAPLLLQKDFILDPLQIYLAKLHGADLILLIAAILAPAQLDNLRKTAESIGLGVLVEVHDAEELEKIQHLDFQVLGINNRDLKTFRTSLNRINTLTNRAGNRFVIAESGVLDYRHFQMVKNADGFLIGTGLMRDRKTDEPFQLTEYFQSKGLFLFKACGIRTAEMLAELTQASVLGENVPHFLSDSAPSLLLARTPTTEIPNKMLDNQGQIEIPAVVGVLANNNDGAQSHAKSEDSSLNKHSVSPDFIGINFSPLSKRQADEQTSKVLKTSQISSAVAVFYQNTQSEIRETIEKHAFKTVQLYAGDVTPEFVRTLKVRVILAVKCSDSLTWSETITTLIEPYAADVDCFILDGANPGSGELIGAKIPEDFPYPFLLAGGLHEGNLEAILAHKNCIGVDIASGIETAGAVDLKKIREITQRLVSLSLPHDLPNRL